MSDIGVEQVTTECPKCRRQQRSRNLRDLAILWIANVGPNASRVKLAVLRGLPVKNENDSYQG